MLKKLVKDFRPYDKASVTDQDADLTDIVQHFVDNPCVHNVCVVDTDNRLLGLINRKRLFKNIFTHHVAADSRVSSLFTYLTARTSTQLMFTHILSAAEEESIDNVITMLIEHNLHEVPILDGQQRVLGILTTMRIMQEWLAGNIK
ncbi:MAG: CBS domain-containing protein [Desulfoferrobacter sp.]